MTRGFPGPPETAWECLCTYAHEMLIRREAPYFYSTPTGTRDSLHCQQMFEIPEGPQPWSRGHWELGTSLRLDGPVGSVPASTLQTLALCVSYSPTRASLGRDGMSAGLCSFPEARGPSAASPSPAFRGHTQSSARGPFLRLQSQPHGVSLNFGPKSHF